MQEKRPEIRISPEIYKMTGDAKVMALADARLSHEAFVLLIGERDPYMLADGVVVALTEAEFYALHRSFGGGSITEEEFRHVLGMGDLSFMQPADAAAVKSMRRELPHCSACRYRKFKDSVRQLIKKYGIDTGTRRECLQCTVRYPECSSPVVSHIHEHTDDLYGISYMQRKACMDCVEKHVSQAYVLAGESHTGYGEYAALVYAHLSEAVAELPEGLGHLRGLLEFCMARTAFTGKPFLPLGSVSAMISLYRKSMDSGADGTDAGAMPENPYMELDITDEIVEEIGVIRLSDGLSGLLKGHLEAADTACAGRDGSDEETRLSWEGHMACASECIAQVAPKLANVIRNRRLLFVADPWLAESAGMSNRDILSRL